jgi:dTMP kinase
MASDRWPGWPTDVCVIAVEGIDGAGKSTLVSALMADQRLKQAFTSVSGMPEFSSPIGSCLRDGLGVMSPLSIAYAFAAERHWLIDHCDATPGALVIWDRYVDSAFACRSADVQAGRAPSQIMDIVTDISRWMPKPALTLYVETCTATAAARLALRARISKIQVRNDETLLEFQQQAYEELWRARIPPPVRINGEAGRGQLLREAVDAILARSAQ